MGKIPESVTSLTNLLEYSPTDAEAWAELSDIYLSQGLYPQAIFALEEVLVLSANAWNVRWKYALVLISVADALAGARQVGRGSLNGRER